MRGRRHRDLDQARNQVACRLHAVLAELVPGGLASEITAARAEAIIGRAPAGDPVAAARRDLAAELLAGLRHVDELICEPKKKLAAAVKAPGTSVTGLFGAGPVVAAIAVSDAAGVSRFATRDRFAAWNGTAPVEVSSGERKIHRLSLRGNRRVNYAIHVAAVTQTRHKHGPGRGFDLDASERVGQGVRRRADQTFCRVRFGGALR